MGSFPHFMAATRRNAREWTDNFLALMVSDAGVAKVETWIAGKNPFFPRSFSAKTDKIYRVSFVGFSKLHQLTSKSIVCPLLVRF